jgi:hypothetical protein
MQLALDGNLSGATFRAPKSGTQHHVSCLKRKSAVACMEQKFRCLRLATDDSQE